LDVTLPSVDADPNRLRQVFANIVTNALQSMPNGGTFTISTRLDVTSGTDGGPDLQTVAVGFEDTGSGIDAAHLKKIFEPLYTTKVRGTGLGLAICSNIMEKHGGRIDVASKVGKGTKFTVHLPLQAPIPKEEPSYDVK
jgi:signal transduction histidine kinase